MVYRWSRPFFCFPVCVAHCCIRLFDNPVISATSALEKSCISFLHDLTRCALEFAAQFFVDIFAGENRTISKLDQLD